MQEHTFTAYIEFDPDTKLFVGTVPTLPGAHTQGATLDELQQNLREVVELCLEEKTKPGRRAGIHSVRWDSADLGNRVSKLSIINASTMEKVLLYLGFTVTRQKGSHRFYRHSDGRTTTVPHHPGRDLARPLIREILREIEVTPEQFQRILQEI